MFLSIVRDFWFCTKFYKQKYQKLINKKYKYRKKSITYHKNLHEKLL